MPDRPTVWEKYKILHATLIELLRKPPSDDQEAENKFRQTLGTIGQVVLNGMEADFYKEAPKKFIYSHDQGSN